MFFSQGNESNLTCALFDDEETRTVFDDEPYSIAWYKNQIPIASSSSGSHIFDKILPEDGGWYTCSTSLNNQRYQTDFLLVVVGVCVCEERERE